MSNPISKEELADNMAAFLFLKRLLEHKSKSDDEKTPLDNLIDDIKSQLGSKIQQYRKYIFLLQIPTGNIIKSLTNFKLSPALQKMDNKLKEDIDPKSFKNSYERKYHEKQI
jgi:hypothetical protein